MKNYLVGDVRLNNDISPIETTERANDFLIELQNLMDLYGVVKVDVAIDVYKYKNK